MKRTIDAIIPNTTNRVSENTDEEINMMIRKNTLRRLEEIGSDRKKIEQRLHELDIEWDIERTLEANAASISLLGLTLGATKHRAWYAIPFLVSGFLLQHAIQGWCPPVPFFRRMGFRTQREINNERAVLLSRIGVFDHNLSDSERELRDIEREDLH